MIVVDTNIIAYFVIAGAQTSLAERVAAIESDWAAPKLWKSEMRNLLTLYLRRSAMTIDEAKAAMQKAELVIADNDYDVNSDRILELSHASGCSAYDCEFISLAERLSVPLVTSDKKLLAAFPRIAQSMEAFASGEAF